MKEIKLSRGKVAIVDDEDFEWLSKYKWYANWNGYNYYAQTHWNRRHMPMQRLIMRPEKGFVVDHINRDSLDNQRSNLRIVTQGVNTQNRAKLKSSRMRYKGVERIGLGCPTYRARICVNGTRIYLGTFSSQEEAAKAYNEASLRYYENSSL